MIDHYINNHNDNSNNNINNNIPVSNKNTVDICNISLLCIQQFTQDVFSPKCIQKWLFFLMMIRCFSKGIFPSGNFPNVQIPKLPIPKSALGNLPLWTSHIWGVATWEIVTWETTLSKQPLGNSPWKNIKQLKTIYPPSKTRGQYPPPYVPYTKIYWWLRFPPGIGGECPQFLSSLHNLPHNSL